MGAVENQERFSKRKCTAAESIGLEGKKTPWFIFFSKEGSTDLVPRAVGKHQCGKGASNFHRVYADEEK